MSDFVNFDNAAHRSGGIYGNVISQVQKDGVCPFCPESLAKYHKNPILKEGKFWLLTDNLYPYEGSKYHELLIHKAHITTFAEISKEAWDELNEFINYFTGEHAIPGGTFIMRFGDTRYTGASVAHLHANFVSPDGEDRDRKPIIVRIG
jgi:diadenosine tetraphosphate (Ap4A) HIT family hydrolase